MIVAKENNNSNYLDVVDLSILRGSKILLEGLSFKANPGDLIWVTGANGTGKTSLLKCLAGLLRPNCGQVTTMDGHASLAYLGHNDGHKKDLSVFENLEFWHGIYAQPVDLEAIMKQVDIRDLRDLKAKNLSAGQSRRVALARLVLRDAKIWLLDEPAAPMDLKGRDVITRLIGAHLAKGGIALIATHSRPQRIGSNAQVLNLGENSDG